VTAGVVSADSRHSTTDQVFEAVNHLLLRGKQAGRNRVVGPSHIR